MYYPMKVVRGARYKLIWNVAYQLPYPFASDLWAAPTWQKQYEQGMQTPGWLQGLLSGSGGYAGQSAYIIGDTSDEWKIYFHGLIFPGDMPAVP